MFYSSLFFITFGQVLVCCVQALPEGEAGELGEASVSFTARCKGQAVVAMIGACAHNDFPLILDLTDGEVGRRPL